MKYQIAPMWLASFFENEVVEPLDIVRFAAVFSNRLMPFRRENSSICSPEIGVADRTLAVKGGKRLPKTFCSTAVT